MEKTYVKLVEELTQHDKLYEITRVVNPKTKKVLVFEENEWKPQGEPCYRFWGYDSACPNCTSMRAINTNKNTYKIQYQLDKSYSVISIPTTVDETPVVLELMSDATNSMDMVDETIKEMKSIIEKTNELTIRDGLTKLYNRKYIDEQLPFLTEIVFKEKKNACVVMVDIDHFKRVNDTYGHQVGDEVLIKLAELLSGGIGKESWAARYGGEEFLIYLANLNTEEAFKIISQIKDTIEEVEFKLDKISFHITASFGLTQISDKDTAKKAIEKADKLLYLAKNSGRNCIKY